MVQVTVKFLGSIIIHNENKEIFKDILDELDCAILIEEMSKIFKAKIHKKEDSLFLGSPPLKRENEAARSCQETEGRATGPAHWDSCYPPS